MNMTYYPTQALLKRGIMLGAITSATMLARHAEFAAYQNWDGKDYVLNGFDGTLGAVTFEGAHVVGVFFDKDSGFNPFRTTTPYAIDPFFEGMPSHLRSFADTRTLLYNRQTFRGRVTSVITAAFWSDGVYLTAAFPWSEVVKHGASIIHKELMDNHVEALAEWQDAYQMSPEQLAFVRSLFDRKCATPNEIIQLTGAEVDWLKSTSDGTGDLELCRESFAPLGIRI